MKITHLALQGFRSFQEEQTVSIPDGPGLCFVGGQNDVEPRLGSNGVGKSSMGEAIVWCLYGVSSGGLKSTVLHARDCEYPMSVTVSFERHGAAYTVTRTHKPNTLLLDSGDGPRTVEQDLISDAIGVPLSTFTHSVFFGQHNQGYFAELRSAEALSLLTDVLDLSRWDESSDNAKEQAAQAMDELTDADKRVGVQEYAVRAHKDNAKVLKTQLAKLKTIQKRATKAVDDKVAGLQERIAELGAEYGDMTTQYRQLSANRDLAKKTFSTEESKLGRIEHSIADAMRATTGIVTRVNTLSTKLEEITEAAVCHACAQDLPKKAHKAAIKLAEERLKQAVAGRSTEKANLKALNKSRTQLEPQVAKARLVYEKTDGLTRDADRDRRVLEDTIDRLEDEIESVRKEAPVVKDSELQELTDKIKDAKKSTKKHRRLLDEACELVHQWKNRLDITKFWQKEFRRIRFWVLKSALLELSIHTENSLRELGLPGWKINYEVDLESARPVFRASIVSPSIEGSLPWGSYSGGESQRLKIAAEVAFCELVRSRCGFRPNIEFWDEPTPHLSADGVTDLMSYMKERSKEFGLQVWIVDHRMPASAAFDSEVLVIKTMKGSTIRLKS